MFIIRSNIRVKKSLKSVHFSFLKSTRTGPFIHLDLSQNNEHVKANDESSILSILDLVLNKCTTRFN